MNDEGAYLHLCGVAVSSHSGIFVLPGDFLLDYKYSLSGIPGVLFLAY